MAQRNGDVIHIRGDVQQTMEFTDGQFTGSFLASVPVHAEFHVSGFAPQVEPVQDAIEQQTLEVPLFYHHSAWWQSDYPIYFDSATDTLAGNTGGANNYYRQSTAT